MRLDAPPSKLALGAEILGGAATLLAFCALAGGASPESSGAHRKVKAAASSAIDAKPPPNAAPPAARELAPLAAPSASAPSAPSTEPVHGGRAGLVGDSGSADLDVARVRVNVGTRVLLFGDSMVNAGLAMRLGNLVKARGGTLEFDGWTSSTTAKWASGERLASLLDRVNPDVVFIALGSNECFMDDPTKAAPNVKAIVAALAGRQCVWIGPPIWKGETGIVGVERRASAPCAFYDSGQLEIARYPDGIHPNLEGGIHWANAVWSALVEPLPATKR